MGTLDWKDFLLAFSPVESWEGVATLLLRIVALGIYIGLLKEFIKWLHGKI